MKYIFATATLLFAFSAQSQTLPAQQVRFGDVQAEVQPNVLSDDHATFDIRNLSGNDAVHVDVRKDSSNRVHLIIRDKNTGKILSDTVMVQNKYADSITESDGVRSELHLRQSGSDDITGTAEYENAHTGESLHVHVQGEQLGSLTQKKQGYTMSLGINGDNTLMTITQDKTKQVICSAVDDGQVSRIYDANKNLIAEGNSDDDSPTRIYDDAAYKLCEKIMNIFDTED